MSGYSGITFGDLGIRVGIESVATMLDHAESQLVLEKFGEEYPMPKNKGQIIRWRRPVPFDVADTALTEGVTPAPQIFEYETIETTIAQYGGWVPLTDVIADTHEDPVLQNITEMLGKQAADTREAIIWGAIRAGTNVQYSGTATSRATVSAPLSYEDIKAAENELKANHGKKITKPVKGSLSTTEPVASAYVAFSHTRTQYDWENMDGFVPVIKYTNPISEYEIGKVGEVRVILTNHLEPFYGAGSTSISGVWNNGTNVDVYCTVVIAKGAFGVVPLKGMNSAQLAVKNPKMGESYEDPLGQRGFVSWKMWYAVKILNDAWLVRIEHAATAIT